MDTAFEEILEFGVVLKKNHRFPFKSVIFRFVCLFLRESPEVASQMTLFRSLVVVKGILLSRTCTKRDGLRVCTYRASNGQPICVVACLLCAMCTICYTAVEQSSEYSNIPTNKKKKKCFTLCIDREVACKRGLEKTQRHRESFTNFSAWSLRVASTHILKCL